MTPASSRLLVAKGRKRRGSSGSPTATMSRSNAPAGIPKPSSTGIAQAAKASAARQPRSATGRTGGCRLVVGW